MGVHVNLKLDGELAEYVSAVTDGSGWYASVEEYVRDLIRQDVRGERAGFDAFREELQAAFAEPIANYRNVSASDVIRRNELRD